MVARVGHNHSGDLVEITAEIKEGKLNLSFTSTNGKSGSCDLEPGEAWALSSDIIDCALKLDPTYIENLIKENIGRWNTETDE